MLELPHTPGCVVCGLKNPHGLKLTLHVDEATGMVTTTFEARAEHIGFEGIVHGGMLATVVDEAMVWAATWKGKRFCVCGELTIRYRHPIIVGKPVKVQAVVDFSRPKLLEASARVMDERGVLLATANGKYVPMTADQHDQVVATLTNDPATEAAAAVIKGF